MARKRLTKGANALRVEERIAKVPLDLGRPKAEGSGVFEALRLLERGSEGERADRPAAPADRPVTPAPRPATPAVRRAPAPPKPAAPAPRPADRATKAVPAPAKHPEDKKKLGPESFTKAERNAIVVSCTEYRNRLPTYLKSAMREVEIIDSILKKCERADEGGLKDEGSAAGPRR